MNKEYVQQYVQLEKAHWWFVVRQKIILYFLHKHIKGSSLKILNIGAAGGASSKWLQEFGEVVSVENESFFIDHLRSEGMNVTDASIISMPFPDNSFDLVCAFDVIEHVEQDDVALKEINRVCKSHGTVCITVPAFQSLWSNHDVVNRHFRRYKKKELHKRIETVNGLSIKEMAYFNSLLFLPIFVARRVGPIFSSRKEDRSDFELYKTSSLLNGILKAVFSFEQSLLKKISFPFGVSLICVLRKTA
ncbi:MAG: class I SAM-dependent methyltransferase [Chitinophagaceae bacterium]|nr:MAG: class I SAM-dependent methyltransferase [Chitinophagaceae bacterium]